MTKRGSLFGGVLLVAGTSIGGGMLALPVLTSLGGFFPSLLIYFFCWIFMAMTGLLLLEVSLWMKKEANLVTMAERTLGAPGKVAAWVLYLFLFYCLTLAYIVGCGNLIVQLVGNTLPDWMGPLLFLIVFAPIVIAGARLVDKVNSWLMLGLGISYFIFVYLGISHVNPELLSYKNWSLSLIALPITFTSFAYQGIIPTLVNYMDHSAKNVRYAIILGTTIPFFAYVLWQILILGIVPTEGPGGLAECFANGDNAVVPLKKCLNSAVVYTVGQFFAFFALVTSFFGVTLGLKDFLIDGLKMHSTNYNKWLVGAMIFLPPLLVALVYPKVFLLALDFAGGFGCALLLGLLPILMVWSGRYRLGMNSAATYQVAGGRPLLILLSGFVLFEIICQVALLTMT